jgi:hypothetical protein
MATDPTKALQSLVAGEVQEAQGVLDVVLRPDFQVKTSEQYEELVGVVREIEGKWKFLDGERKVAVSPLNDEVKRINDWFRPALDTLKKIADRGREVLGVYVLAQRREEARLRAEAEAAAQRVLAAAPDAQADVKQIVKAGAQVSVPKVSGASVKPVFKFKVVDASKLERRFLQPDLSAIGAWVTEHGLKGVPAGVEVEEDVKFSLRRA